jgi:hypothetical protein
MSAAWTWEASLQAVSPCERARLIQPLGYLFDDLEARTLMVVRAAIGTLAMANPMTRPLTLRNAKVNSQRGSVSPDYRVVPDRFSPLHASSAVGNSRCSISVISPMNTLGFKLEIAAPRSIKKVIDTSKHFMPPLSAFLAALPQ